MKKILNYMFFSWIGILFWTLLLYNVGWRIMIVPSSSMENTLFPGDVYVANVHKYGINSPTLYNIYDPELKNKIITKKPNVGDVIIFKHNGILMVKRCIGIEGDLIEIIERNVSVNGKMNPYIKYVKYDENKTSGFDQQKSSSSMEYLNGIFSEKVKKRECFVLGDNRNNSKDSRFIGTIKYEDIIGKASFRIFSLKEEVMFTEIK